jgi:hypothetical protein
MATLWVQVLDFCGYVRGQCTLALIGVHCTASPPLSSALLPHQITSVHSASFTVGGSDGGGVPIGDGVDTVPRYWCSPSPHHQRIAPPPRLTLSLALSNSVALEDEAQSYDRDELNALVRSTSPPLPVLPKLSDLLLGWSSVLEASHFFRRCQSYRNSVRCRAQVWVRVSVYAPRFREYRRG